MKQFIPWTPRRPNESAADAAARAERYAGWANPPLTFPDRPCRPVDVAIFDDSHSWHRPARECPWAWTATIAAAIVIVGLCTRGHLW